MGVFGRCDPGRHVSRDGQEIETFLSDFEEDISRAQHKIVSSEIYRLVIQDASFSYINYWISREGGIVLCGYSPARPSQEMYSSAIQPLFVLSSPIKRWMESQ
jgi:hypothetical protein